MYIPYEMSKKITLDRFYSLFEITYDSNFSFWGEAHDFWEMVYVEKGNICACADAHILHLSAGEVIFHKPMEFHRLSIENNKHATVFIISFATSGSTMKMFENCVLQLSDKQKNSFRKMIVYLRENCQLNDKFDNALIELKKHPSKAQTFTCMLELLLLSLAQGRVPIDAIEISPDTQLYHKAVCVMEEHIGEWLSVPQLAQLCNVSLSCLKRVFLKYSSLGVHRYYLKLKLTHASRMLNNGKSIVEVSEALSFSSPNYFSTVYKRENGISPSVSQKKHNGY